MFCTLWHKSEVQLCNTNTLLGIIISFRIIFVTHFDVLHSLEVIRSEHYKFVELLRFTVITIFLPFILTFLRVISLHSLSYYRRQLSDFNSDHDGTVQNPNTETFLWSKRFYISLTFLNFLGRKGFVQILVDFL